MQIYDVIIAVTIARPMIIHLAELFVVRQVMRVESSVKTGTRHIIGGLHELSVVLRRYPLEVKSANLFLFHSYQYFNRILVFFSWLFSDFNKWIVTNENK